MGNVSEGDRRRGEKTVDSFRLDALKEFLKKCGMMTSYDTHISCTFVEPFLQVLGNCQYIQTGAGKCRAGG